MEEAIGGPRWDGLRGGVAGRKTAQVEVPAESLTFLSEKNTLTVTS